MDYIQHNKLFAPLRDSAAYKCIHSTELIAFIAMYIIK